MLTGLSQMLFKQALQSHIGSRGHHLRQHVEGEPPLDPQELRQHRDDQILRVRELLHATLLLFSRSAQRSARAMITSAGFAAPCVGSTEPSTTNRFGTPHTRW